MAFNQQSELHLYLVVLKRIIRIIFKHFALCFISLCKTFTLFPLIFNHFLGSTAAATTAAQQSGCRCGLEKTTRIVGGAAIDPVILLYNTFKI